MSDDMLIHFSSNSSNQSDQSLTKIAKLEARLVGKGSASGSGPSSMPLPAQTAWPSAGSSKFGVVDDVGEASTSSDSDDDVSLYVWKFSIDILIGLTICKGVHEIL